MLSLQGNTAPYMLYARTRVCSIVRKAQGLSDSDPMSWPAVGKKVVLNEAEEVALARHIVRFGDTIRQVGRDLYPNVLCDYLFELSQKFSAFYETCPVNQAETEEIRESRLTLAVVTNDVLVRGMDILGIEVVDRM
jgi:arginyl-tRNA synthetase